MHSLPANPTYQILPSTSFTNGDNQVQNQTAQNKLMLPGIISSRYVNEFCTVYRYLALIYQVCDANNKNVFFNVFQNSRLPTQIDASISKPIQLSSRKENIDIDPTIVGGMINSNIKQEGKKGFCYH